MITPAFGLTATERVLPKLALDFTTASLDSRVTFTRTTGASYVNSSGVITAATINQPRFDYDPIALTCKGLLIEESRTNTFTYSEQLASSWTPTRITINPDQTTAPDGNNTADALTADVSTSTSHYMINTQSFTSGTTYSWSVFAKVLGTAGYRLRLRYNSGAFGATLTADFDLNAGTVAARSGGISASIQAFPNGWYRCTFIATATVTASDAPWIMFTSGGNQNFIGDGTSGAYVWGAQLEAGAFATSYIPTTASQVTRTADVATMTGTNFSSWYSAGAGGVVTRVLPSTVSGTRPVLQFDDNTANEVIALRGNTTNPELSIVDGGAPQSQIDAGTIAANTIYNLGAAWATDNCAAAVNGGASVTDTTATIPTVTQARLGSDGANYLNGQLQSVRYWPQRIINAEVQAFSKG